MSDERPPDLTPVPKEPEMRLVPADSGIRRIWAVYSNADDVDKEPPSEGGLTLGELVVILTTSYKTVTAWVVAIAFLGFLYIQLSPPIYLVEGSVLIVPRAKLSRLNREMDTTLKFLMTQAEVLSSEAVIAEVVPSLSFDAGAEPPPRGLIGQWLRDASVSLRASLAHVLPISPVRQEKRRDPVAVISNALTASPVFETNIVRLTYVGPSRLEAVEVLGKVLVAYRDFVQRMEEEDSRQDFRILIDREEELRSRLDQLNERYAETLAASDVVGVPGDDFTVQQLVLTGLGRDLVAARSQRIALENDLHVLNQYDDVAFNRFNSLGRERMRTTLWRAQVRLAENRTKFDASHPEVLASTREVEALEAQLLKLDELRRGRLEIEIAALRATEERLEQAYGAESQRAREVTAQMLSQRHIVLEVERLTEDHRATLEILRDAQLTREGIDTGRVKVAVHVIDEPLLPLEAMWPKNLQVLGMCLLIGGGFGLFHAWLRGRPDLFVDFRKVIRSDAAVSSATAEAAKEEGASVAST